jgi:hypothetical protein
MNLNKGNGYGARSGSVVLGLLALVAFLVASLVSVLQFNSDAATLRNTAMRASGGGWERVVQLGLGRTPFALANWGLSFVELEPEVRQAIGSLRGVHVGVYERPQAVQSSLAAVMADTDEAMTRRGWYRVVGVLDGHDLVAVYTPAKADALRDLQACVMVISEGQLVVVSARCNPEPLIELAQAKAGHDWPNLGPIAHRR